MIPGVAAASRLVFFFPAYLCSVYSIIYLYTYICIHVYQFNSMFIIYDYYMFLFVCFSVMCYHKRGNIYVRRVGTIRNMLRRLAGSTVSQDISHHKRGFCVFMRILWDGVNDVNVPSQHAERSAPEVDSAPTRRRSLDCMINDWFRQMNNDEYKYANTTKLYCYSMN